MRFVRDAAARPSPTRPRGRRQALHRGPALLVGLRRALARGSESARVAAHATRRTTGSRLRASASRTPRPRRPRPACQSCRRSPRVHTGTASHSTPTSAWSARGRVRHLSAAKPSFPPRSSHPAPAGTFAKVSETVGDVAVMVGARRPVPERIRSLLQRHAIDRLLRREEPHLPLGRESRRSAPANRPRGRVVVGAWSGCTGSVRRAATSAVPVPSRARRRQRASIERDEQRRRHALRRASRGGAPSSSRPCRGSCRHPVVETTAP